MDFINVPILMFGMVLSVSILTSVVSIRVGVPLILAFLCIGILAGSGSIDVFESFQHPKIAFFIGSVALALILFDSGFRTSMHRYRQVSFPSLVLATLGVFISTLLLAPIVRFILGVDWIFALLLASMVSSTDAAAVFFLLRSRGVFLRERVQSTLEIESGANDPMAIFLTFAFIILIQQTSSGPISDLSFLVPSFLGQLFVGAGCGYFLFLIMRLCVNKISLETALYPIFILGLALIGFAVTNMLGGSGYLALYMAGLLLGNEKIRAHGTISKFQQTTTWLSQILMFITLGMFVDPVRLKDIWTEAFVIGTALIFVVRPIMVFSLLSWFKSYTFREKGFISFVGLRGATSILLALAPIVYHLPHGESFFNIVFVMVLYSLAFQGFLITPVSKILGVALPETQKRPERTEVDLPGLDQSSLIFYEITENTPILKQKTIPGWARPTLIIRGGVAYQSASVRRLKIGDKVYVFAPSERRLPLLDQLYGSETEQDELGVWGDFPISPFATFTDLQKNYGLEIPLKFRDKKIGDLIAQEFPDMEVGDRLSLEQIELVVREVENGYPTRIGIDINPMRRKSFFDTRIKTILTSKRKKD